MKIDMQSVDELTATLSINIEKADYEPSFKSELKKYAGKASMKGFRKGKTPIGVVKKMYGQSVLAEVINNTLQDALSSYLKDEKLDILGQPLPSKDQEGDLVFDAKNLTDYTFKFDIGLSPKFELSGVSEKDNYEIYDVTIDKDIVEEEIGFITKRLGKQEEAEGKIEGKDIITINAEELDGTKPKKDGWATEFTVMVDTLADEYKDAILKMSKGDSLNFDIYALESGKDEDYVNKYLLNRTSEEDQDREINKDFSGKIEKIMRLAPAAFDQELFDKYFPEGDVKSEKDAKAKIEENIKKHYDNQATQIMYRNIMDGLIENTSFDLPQEFLKRWVKETNQEATEEQIDKDFDGFLQNLKWTLIKSKLSEQFDVKVEPSEVYNAMEAKVKGYFGQYGMDPSQVGEIMKNMMQNKEEVNKTYEELQADKVFSKIGEIVGRKTKKITVKDFNEMVKELNAKQQAA